MDLRRGVVPDRLHHSIVNLKLSQKLRIERIRLDSVAYRIHLSGVVLITPKMLYLEVE